MHPEFGYLHTTGLCRGVSVEARNSSVPRKATIPVADVELAAAELEQFWHVQQRFEGLELRRIVSGQTSVTLAVLEIIEDRECNHDPLCGAIQHKRATITLARRWRDRKETEVTVLEIHQPSGYQVFLPSGFGLPVSPRAIENIPALFVEYLQSTGIIPLDTKDQSAPQSPSPADLGMRPTRRRLNQRFDDSDLDSFCLNILPISTTSLDEVCEKIKRSPCYWTTAVACQPTTKGHQTYSRHKEGDR